MEKKFGYRKADILFPYGFLLLIPVSLAYFLLHAPLKADAGDPFARGLYVFLWAIFALLFVPVLTWILNNIRTVIILTETGIIKKDLFGEKVIRWNEIARVDKKYLYEGSYARYRYEAPGDLVIYGANGKRMHIYKIIHGLDGSGEKIAELEQEIYKRIDVAKYPDTRGYEKNQLRLGIAAGVLVIVAALAMERNPPRDGVGLLGLLNRLLGIGGATLAMVTLGCLVILFFIHQLRNFSNKQAKSVTKK